MTKNTPSILKEQILEAIELTPKEIAEIYQKKQDRLSKLFFKCCKNQDFEMIRFMLTSPELEVHYDPSNASQAVAELCKHNAYEIVQYLLTSPDLEKHYNINCGGDLIIYSTCEAGHLDLAKYLLTSPTLKRHSNAYNMQGRAILAAQKHPQLMTYLVEEYGLEEAFISWEAMPNVLEYIRRFKEKEHLNQNLSERNEHPIIRKKI